MDGRRMWRGLLAFAMLCGAAASPALLATPAGAQPPLNGGDGWTSYPDPNPGSGRAGQSDNGEIPLLATEPLTLAKLEAAFTNARTVENADLCPGGVCEPGATVMPTDFAFPADYLSRTDSERALWLLNSEREARGLLRYVDVEVAIETMAQDWATAQGDQFTLVHNPIRVIQYNSLCSGCVGNYETGVFNDGIAETLYRRVQTCGSTGPTPEPSLDAFGIERAIYAWMYFDLDLGGTFVNQFWGHRHELLWDDMINDHGWTGSEGFLGLGISRVVEEGTVVQDGTTFNTLTENEFIVLNMVDTRAAFPAPDIDGYATGEDIGVARLAGGAIDVALPSANLACREDPTVMVAVNAVEVFSGVEDAALETTLESALTDAGVAVGDVVTIQRPGCDRSDIALTVTGSSAKRVTGSSASSSTVPVRSLIVLAALGMCTVTLGALRRFS